MLDLKGIIDSFRFTFGGVLGALLGVVVYLRFGSVGNHTFLVVFSVVGNALGSTFEKTLVSPLIEHFAFDARLDELQRLLDEGKINQESYQKYVNQLVERRVLEQPGWTYLFASRYRTVRSKLSTTPREPYAAQDEKLKRSWSKRSANKQTLSGP